MGEAVGERDGERESSESNVTLAKSGDIEGEGGGRKDVE